MPKKTKPKDKKETSIILPNEVSIALKTVVSIKQPEDMAVATSTLSTLNKALDYLTEQKEKLTKPANQILKETRARYKPYETQLENKINEIRSLMTAFQTKQIAIQQKKESDLAAKVAAGTISIEKAADKLNKLPELVNNTVTDAGSVKFKPVKKWSIVDLSKLPIEYHLPNESMIRTAMNDGKELPGVKYFVEQIPYNSR